MKSKRLRVYICLVTDHGLGLWHRQFPAALKAMGHEVHVAEGLGISESGPLSQAGLWTKSDRARLTERIFEDFATEHRRQRFDLFFAFLYPVQFDPELFDHVAALGTPSVYYFCDNLFHQEVARRYARHATLNWVPEKAAMRNFKAAGARAVHLPMAANPSENFSVGGGESLDVIFPGARNPFRRQVLGYAISKGVDLTLFGSGWIPSQISHNLINYQATAQAPLNSAGRWHRLNQWLTFKSTALVRFCRHGLRPARESRAYAKLGEEYESLVRQHAHPETVDLARLNALYSEARVTIGINDQFNPVSIPALYCYPKMREFEATMSGACYLTQRTEETEDLFDTEKEIAVYSSPEELVEKTRELLGSPTRRAQMRVAAARRSNSDHTWQRRFETIFRELGL